MRRAVSSLLSFSSSSSSSSKSRFFSTSLLSRFSPQSPSTIYPPLSTVPLLQSARCPPSRRVQTLPFRPLSSQSAPTARDVLAAYESLESSLDDDRLALAERLDLLDSQELAKALAFSVRALQFFERRDGGWSLPVAKVLRLMGYVSCKMRKFDDSVASLETAAQITDMLRRENSADKDVVMVSIAVQLQLASTKTAVGRRREASVNLRNSLELKGLIFEHDSKEMGHAYRDLAEAYAVVLDFGEALPLGLRALDIYIEQFGENSREVVQIRRLLGVIYTGLGEHEEALEQNELSRRVLESLCVDEELLQVEIDAAKVQIELGRFEQATNTLKRVIGQTDKESELRAFVFISMAKVLYNEEKFGDSKRCLEMSCGILDKKELSSPAKVAEAYAEMSMIYETMDDFEIALSLMKRSLAIVQGLPEEQYMEGSISSRIGCLLLFTERVAQSLPYLESAVVKLKDCYGPKHYGLGLSYKYLGQAYLNMDQPQSAIKLLVLAKDIIDKSLGMQHENSIDTYQCLANAYGTMGRYDLAMKFQQHVLDAYKNLGPNFSDDYREAYRLFEQLRKRAQGSTSAVFPANSLPAVLLRN